MATMRERQRAVQLYRGQIPSPGRPTVAWRQDRVQFWAAIARGASSEDAALEIGVSSAVGARWFRHAGGVNPFLAPTVSGRYLSFAEREDIAIWRAQKLGVREIARRLNRSPSTISRELRRNASTRTWRLEDRASTAQWHAERRARRPKPAKLVANERLRGYVQDRLAGVIRAPDGAPVLGPAAPWTGRNKPRRQDRRWATAWSPEQIANRLPVDFPDDGAMRISHEAIYQALYVQGRGALKRELVACLRTGRALRVPRARARTQPGGHVTRQVLISERPAEAEDRAVPGHWEGDLIIGLNRSAIGTVVERSTRFTMLVHLPRRPGYGSGPRVRNGPALAGDGAEAMREALASRFASMPEQLRRSLTWDRGKELAQHAQLTIATGLAIYFADPHSPWQRGTNENTNGLLRQYLPKGTDLSRWSRDEIEAIAGALNARPRRTLGWKTPPKPSTSSYCYANRAVLRRPLEPGQDLSIRYTERLAEAGAVTSVGSRGDSFDNALAETIIGLYKTELIRRRGPWKGIDEVEYATLEWVDWFNHRRLLEPIGHVPPVEFEAAYCRREDPSRAAGLKHPSLR